MPTIEQLSKDIEQIKERNKRVEFDKAWETSLSRKITIAFLTYAVITLFLLITNFPDPFVSAIVPSIGFLISTLSFSTIRKYWIKSQNIS